MQERAAYGKLVAMANEADTARIALQVIFAAGISLLLSMQHTITIQTMLHSCDAINYIFGQLSPCGRCVNSVQMQIQCS